MACAFCYAQTGDNTLDPKTRRKIIDKIADAGVPKLVLTGGEPLLVPNLIDTITHGFNRDLFLTLHTNGLLLTEEMIRAIKGKIKRVSLAIDGATPNINDAVRDKIGHFERTIETLECLRRHDIPISMKTIATTRNHTTIPDIATTLAEFNPDIWLITEFTPLNRGALHAQELALRDEDIAQLINELSKVTEVPYIFTRDPLRGGFKKPYFFISPKGEVYTNNYEDRSQPRIGSILTDTVSSLWKKILDITPIQNGQWERK